MCKEIHIRDIIDAIADDMQTQEAANPNYTVAGGLPNLDTVDDIENRQLLPSVLKYIRQ